MLDLAQLTPQDQIVDLGSGDGRIPLAAAARGARALGIEIDPALVAESRRKAHQQKLETQATFRVESFFESDLRSADVVTVFLSPQMNQELAPKLLQELASGSRVVTHLFPMEGWQAERVQNLNGRRIFLYRIP